MLKFIRALSITCLCLAVLALAHTALADNAMPSSGYANASSLGVVANDGTDQTANFNNAINYCVQNKLSLYLPTGTYMVKLYANSGVSGMSSIILKSNVSILGQSQSGTIIRLMPNNLGPGALTSIFAINNSSGLQNVTLSSFTVDGNSMNQSGVSSSNENQASNIMLSGPVQSLTIENITSINAYGMGIQVKGLATSSSGAAPVPVQNLVIKNNVVNNVDNIGIQVSQFNGIQILNNKVSNTGNNGIDIYGADYYAYVAHGYSNTSDGQNFTIQGNDLAGIGVSGIFLETVMNGTAVNNSVMVANTGLSVNQIWNEPASLTVENNTFHNVGIGFNAYGDVMGTGLNIKGNAVYYTYNGAQLGAACGSTAAGVVVGYVNINGNIFVPASTSLPVVTAGGSEVSLSASSTNTVLVPSGDSVPSSQLFEQCYSSSTANPPAHVSISSSSFVVSPVSGMINTN